MNAPEPSEPLCRELEQAAADPVLEIRHRPARYGPGRVLRYNVRTVHPAASARVELEIEEFLGGGFAWQVYRCRLTRVEADDWRALGGLQHSRRYALKILVPPSGFARAFRNAVYWLAFQGPFSAQISEDACRAGLLCHKIIRRAAGFEFGRDTAVKDVYASLHDPSIGAWGELSEWVEGRAWRLEADDRLDRRGDWRTIPLDESPSPEYVGKRRFMARMVRLLHALGMPEFARQYEWSTMKSQPNVLWRTDAAEGDAESRLCAIDFRAGLALLPFLPMSPGDVMLILRGFVRRGAWVQFDRPDWRAFQAFVAENPSAFADLRPAIEELTRRDRTYRRSLPDITHRAWTRLRDPEVRRDIRYGLVRGWLAADLIDEAFAERLGAGGSLFARFYLLGAVPLLGRALRHRWGHAAFRRHVARILTSASYRSAALRAHAAIRLIGWHRTGRASERRARWLAAHPGVFLAERLTIGWLPRFLHRFVLCPALPVRAVSRFIRDVRQFLLDAAHRERWFLGQVEEGERAGMLTPDEAAAIRGRVKDPFIVQYLRSLGVHLATLPVSEIVFVVLASGLAGWTLAHGGTWQEVTTTFVKWFAIFQLSPISPGSILRALYVVYLMIRDRNVRDYIVAAPVSLLKGVGYLAFPLQMTATYPHLARFMAARWATAATHAVPVFGERGALLEHIVFDASFNVPQNVARWARPRIRGLLDTWMAIGLGLAALFVWYRWPITWAFALELGIPTLCLFVLPRFLFLPMLARPRTVRRPGPPTPPR